LFAQPAVPGALGDGQRGRVGRSRIEITHRVRI
jgi:hypothetical protein